MKKHLFLSSFLCFLIAALSAQTDTFDISDYYYPDIKRNQLDFSLNAYGGNYNRNNNFTNMTGKSKQTQFNGENYISYNNYKNNRRKISSLSINNYFEGDYITNNSSYSYPSYPDSESTYESLYLTNNFSASWSNNHYLLPKLYLIYEISASFDYEYKNNKDDNTSYKSSENEYSFQPTIGVGFGRIERVEDARQALYIIDALNKEDQLNRNLTSDEVFELSQIISKLKNKRFLDNRLRQIEELTTIDKFFKAKDLLSDDGARYFTTLYDMWQYGGVYTRNSGRNISFRIKSQQSFYDFHKTSLIDPDTSIYNKQNYAAEINYNYEKPWKLNWQHSLNLNIEFSDFNTNQEDADFTKYNALRAYGSYRLGYFPSTRTYMGLKAIQEFMLYTDLKTNEFTNIDSNTLVSAEMSYYISPQLRISGGLGLIYNTKQYKSDFNNGDFNNSIFQFGLGFNYYIF